jgi:hypothetical protein
MTGIGMLKKFRILGFGAGWGSFSHIISENYQRIKRGYAEIKKSVDFSK